MKSNKTKILIPVAPRRTFAASFALTAFIVTALFLTRVQAAGICPGASGSVTLLNKALPAAPGAKTIDALTAATGQFSDEFARIQGTDSALGCGQNSRYSVKWSVVRTSWTAP